MPTFLIEIHMADAGDREFDRAVRMLNAAQTRLREAGTNTRTTIAGLSREDGRLVCLVDAPSLGVGATPGGRGPPTGWKDPRDHQPRGHTAYSAVTQEAMLALELKPSLLRML